MVFGLLGLAAAGELQAGAGASASGGVARPSGRWDGGAAAGAEAWLHGGGALGFDLALDANVGLLPAGGVALLPEAVHLRGEAGPVWLGAGIAPAPWRVEAVDAWDTPLVTWSVEERAGLPGSLLGAEVGVGDPERGARLVAGLDLGRGLDLAGDIVGALGAAPILVGAHGALGGDGLSVQGGLFAWPERAAVAGQLGAVAELEGLRLSGQAVGGWNATPGGHVQAELFPEESVSPVARAEVLGGLPGGAVGLDVRPVGWLRIGAEVGYADEAPQAWLEVAASGETGSRGASSGGR